jgi:hypothetical protein
LMAVPPMSTPSASGLISPRELVSATMIVHYTHRMQFY